MIHVCFLSGMYGIKDPLIVERQGKSLVCAGYKVTYITSMARGHEIIYGMDVIDSGFRPGNRFSRMFLSSRYLLRRAIEVDADIYQISEPEQIMVGVRLKNLGKKVIFNMRENYINNVMFKTYIPTIFRRMAAQRLEKIFKVQLPKYDAVFSVTDDITEQLKQLSINSHTVRNFPVVDPTHIIAKSDYMSRDNLLLYYGTVYSISCQREVMDAIQGLTNLRYRVAGPCEENYSDHQYWNKVIYSGFFTKDELQEFYKEATISNVLRDFSAVGTPNGSYGILKMFESMEAGLPILCSDVKINREIIQKYNCGICVNPLDVQQIRAALKFLIDNKEIAYEMGQNGRRAVIEEFNWDNEFNIYISLLQL